MRKLLALIFCLLATSSARAFEPHPLAGMFVKSKRYVIRRSPQKEEELSGDVYYRQREQELRADWALFRHETETWLARGNVRATWHLKDGDVIDVRGHEARYDERSQRGALKPEKPGALITIERASPSSTEPDSGEARELEWDGLRQEARLIGDVRFRGEAGRAWSGLAVYDHRDRTLVLTKRRPVLARDREDWSGAVQADRIAARASGRLVEADGKVQGWLYFPQETALKKP